VRTVSSAIAVVGTATASSADAAPIARMRDVFMFFCLSSSPDRSSVRDSTSSDPHEARMKRR
jgi:hypothetical protein